jgi:cytochrome c oxidase assembly protein subunit 15
VGRFFDPPIARRILVANVVVQAGIVVTGALVRLTGSGLGCPTWPQCTGDSLVPVAGQEEGFRKLIEFGNRTLTFLLAVVAIAAIVVAVRRLPRRRPLIALAFVCLAGIAGQAVLGGITVLTGLNPWSVGSHFLLSIALIAAAVALLYRWDDDGDARRVLLVRPELWWWSWLTVAIGLVVVVLGVLVTGSGPHGGDAEVLTRLPFDPRTMSWLHADAVLLFLGVSVGLWIALRLTDAPPMAIRRTAVLLIVSIAQGAVGYLQYFIGLPWVAVAVHVVGACMVWVAVLRIPFALRSRDARLAR